MKQLRILTGIISQPVTIMPDTLSPGAIDLIKVMALLAMMVDHFNTLFIRAPAPELYALGRMAFPLFTMIWAVNITRAPARLQARANRLWIWAVVTQPAFALAFHNHFPWYVLNILFVFAGVTQLLAWRAKYAWKGVVTGIILLTALIYPLWPASYGLQGVLLALGLAVYFDTGITPRQRELAGAVSFASLFSLNGLNHLAALPFETMMVAILPTMLLPWFALQLAVVLMPAGRERFMPRRFFYAAYIWHLFLFGITLYMMEH